MQYLYICLYVKTQIFSGTLVTQLRKKWNPHAHNRGNRVSHLGALWLSLMCRVSIRVAIHASAVLVAVTTAVLLHSMHRNVSVYNVNQLTGDIQPKRPPCYQLTRTFLLRRAAACLSTTGLCFPACDRHQAA